MFDYSVADIPLSWLTCNSKESAIRWHEKNCGYLPDEFIEPFALAQYRKLKKWRKQFEPEKKKKTKKEKMIEKIKKEQKKLGNL